MDLASAPSTRFDRYIGVVGPGGDIDDSTYATAREVGRLVTVTLRAAVVCGGLGGVMTAASEGASGAGGLSIGFLPGVEVGSEAVAAREQP